MNSSILSRAYLDEAPLPVARDGMPIFYEDEEEGDMGESNPHVVNDEIIHVCVKAHLAGKPRYRVYSNMNLYYRKGPRHRRTKSLPYVSPDIMVVEPFEPLDEDITSYTIGVDGPAPRLVTEILSKRSAQQRDLREKLTIYARLGVAEYLLVDPSGEHLPERLLLKRLQPNGSWADEQDPDGGVTSRLGFRVIWDIDDRLRVIETKTGKRYVRPDEAQIAADLAAEKIRELHAELERLRNLPVKKQDKKTTNGRRRKS